MSKLITGSSLLLGSLIVILFNFLLPGNIDSFSKNVTEVTIMTENYGSNSNLVQIYLVAIGLGLLIFLYGILGLYKNVSNRENNFKYIFIALNIAFVVLFLVVISVGTAFSGAAEQNMQAFAYAQSTSQMAAQAAQSGDQAIMLEAAQRESTALMNSIIAGSSSAAMYTLFWGILSIAGYIFYIATASTGLLILRSGNYYLSKLMNNITGFGFITSGTLFLILNIIWKVNTEWGYRIFSISQIVWFVFTIVLTINLIRSKKK